MGNGHSFHVLMESEKIYLQSGLILLLLQQPRLTVKSKALNPELF